MNLDGQVALVTGASRGIGKEIAISLAQAGAQIALVAPSLDMVEPVAQEFAEMGLNARPYGADISVVEQCNDLVAQVTQEMGGPHILVNNAGITRDGLLMRMTDEQWHDVIQVNLTGAFYMTRAVTRPMLRAKNGRIINISSVVGLMGNAGQANYAASKAGLIGLTKSVARELAPKGITVNAIAPGFIETPMTASLPDEVVTKLKEQIPLGSFGQPQDIANLVTFLASPMARYITGEVIRVDGGMAI